MAPGLDSRQAAGALVFAATFLLLALGRLGRLHLPRGATALAGGVVTAILFGIVPTHHVIDLDVMMVLTGLMALAGLCQASGLFAPLETALLRMRPLPALLMALAAVAVASAALLNDAAVVVLLPLVLPPLRRQGFPAAPTVILAAVAANVGSLLTPFGNPQNAVLARAAGLGLGDTLRGQALGVLVGALGLAASAWLLSRHRHAPEPADTTPPPMQGRAWAALAVAGFVAASAWTGRPGPSAVAAALGLLVALSPQLRGAAWRGAWRGIDLNVLLLFLGLYLLTAAIPHWFPPEWVPNAMLDSPVAATAGVALLSNTVGNVPATLTLLQLDRAWVVSHASFLIATTTLGGALLLTGSAASLLAADVAKRHGVEVRFLPFVRWAVPCVLPALAAAAAATWR